MKAELDVETASVPKTVFESSVGVAEELIVAPCRVDDCRIRESIRESRLLFVPESIQCGGH